MSTEQHTSYHTRYTPSSSSTAMFRSSTPSLCDNITSSTDLIVEEHKTAQPTPSMIDKGEGTSTTREHPHRTARGIPSSIEMLLNPAEEAESSNNQTIHTRSSSNLRPSAPPGLPLPAPSARFKSPQRKDDDPALADLKQELHYSYDTDLSSGSSTMSLLPPPRRQSRAPSPPLEGFSLLPAIELRSEVLEEGIPPSEQTRKALEAMCHWSLYDAAREQQEFVRKTVAQRQIYETAFAALEDELGELDVGSNSEEDQMALFEDDSDESEGGNEEGEIYDSDDEEYEQDVGPDRSDELEEVFPTSESDSSPERYALSYEVDAENSGVSNSELADADSCEQGEGYDANSNSCPGDDPFAQGPPYSLAVQGRNDANALPLEASDLSDDDGFGELSYPYTLEEIERQNRDIEVAVGANKDEEAVLCFEVLDGEIFSPAGAEDSQDDRPEVFIDSDEEFEQEEARIYGELERIRPLWSIHSKILPPARNPPTWYPDTLPIFDVEDPDVIPSLRFDRVKTLAPGNGLSSVCAVRSRWPQRWNGVGLKEDSLWAMKLYPKESRDAEKKRRAATLLHTEVDVYMRIAESPKKEKIGFAFLTNLEMTVTFPGNTGLVMALGVATLHSIGIIHRDLKPENIFIDYRGNVKIGDFGTSFVTRSFSALQCDVDYDESVGGTTEYVSPEMQSEGGMHGIEVDYWALGCVFFEMMADDHVSLFPRSRPRELEDWVEYSKTQEGREAFFEYEGFNEDEADLLCGLLRPNPRRRYGIDEILEHRYFLRDDGTSEFRHIEEGLSRPRREPVFGPDERPRIRITPNPVDDTVFNWANPYGACFADRTRRASTRGPGSQWT